MREPCAFCGHETNPNGPEFRQPVGVYLLDGRELLACRADAILFRDLGLEGMREHKRNLHTPAFSIRAMRKLKEMFPDIGPMTVDEALAFLQRREDEGHVFFFERGAT